MDRALPENLSSGGAISPAAARRAAWADSVKGLLRRQYNRAWGYRNPRRVWEAWGRSYASDAYLSQSFPQDRWMAGRLQAAGARRILEVGCGAGRLIKAVPGSFEDAGLTAPFCAGVDFSTHVLAGALHGGASPGMVAFAAGIAESLPFRAGSFDWACTHGCLMHIPRRQGLLRALREMGRVAARGLVLIEQIPPEGMAGLVSGYTPNGLAYFWDYEDALAELGWRVQERAEFQNAERVGCWLAVKDIA
jgi:SAM-dependent methyltransferase